ncbi:MAG: hypothetical protein PHY54_04020, partial [Methylococcales bacterium]|nr:hypothetical protein [Methylococcales bacterium]
SSATLAFCMPVKIFRLLSLIFCLFFTTGHSLNYCPDFGVHYKSLEKRQSLVCSYTPDKIVVLAFCQWCTGLAYKESKLIFLVHFYIPGIDNKT